ncbi:hypothetical protein Dda_8646 [Drechslerella dactyloides]|uniref:DUF3835 domain-containing protein n=1 Tax=Drechslerella dactyloides TaxID=74499 RepID=A0AAD6NG07_DREDA|nr:hypothetical protein Dda_8646 [Drechslerella dactyloides]
MDTIEVTEKQRLQLEESISKLRKGLKHWQVHSAEYEGLKEELLALPKKAGRTQMLAIADDFGGDVITRTEISSFLGDKEGITRTPVQVAEAVRHRIDYIQGNIDKLEKHLELGETTLDNVRIIENSGQLTNEEGLPVMDIKEELDDRGDVIRSDVTPGAGSAKPFNVQSAIESFQPLVDTLAKKQQQKEDAAKSVQKPAQGGSSTKSTSSAPKSASTKRPSQPPTKEQIQQKEKPAPKTQPRTPKRIQATEKEYAPQSGMILTEKRVKAKLVPDVKEELPKPAVPDTPSVKEIVATPPEPTQFITNDEQLKQMAKEGVARIRVLDDDEDEDEDSDASDDPFENLPEVEESEEDARLREEMIRYNMRNMNNIVAEIDLEDNQSDDEDYDESGDEETDEEEDEDQWGRSKGQLVSDRIRREMTKLQKKMEAREKAEQVANEVAESTTPIVSVTTASLSEQASVQDKAIPKEPAKKEKKKSSEKKGVRFAEDLDIAPAPVPISKPPSNASELVKNEFDDEDIDPSILDMIFGPGTKDQEERYFQNTIEEPKKKLPSLFRAARQVQKAKEQLAAEKAVPAPNPQPASSADSVVPGKSAAKLPGSYDIIERTPSASAPAPPKPTGKLPVRSKAPSRPKDTTPTNKTGKSENAPAPTLDPLGDELSDEDRPIMASSIIERAPTWQASTASVASPSAQRAPKPPDELDPEFHQREVTDAYFAMRNKLIQRQGGFVETEEEKSIVPIDENMDKKKVSRFKAGRVKSQLP